MFIVEKHIHDLLCSKDLLSVKDGLSNVLYWGYANSPGLQKHRVRRFRDAVADSDSRLEAFAELTESHPLPTLLCIRQVELPQFSQTSFASKILMFLDPAIHPVLDLKISRAFANKPCFPPLLDLTFNDTGIPITQKNVVVYEKWACWCRGIAALVNGLRASPRHDLRAVDIERALFTLAGNDGDEDDPGKARAILRGPEGWTLEGP